MLGNFVTYKLLAIARSPKARLLHAVLRDLLFSYLLLILSGFFQVCGWHRVYLKVPGWYLFPLSIVAPIAALITSNWKWVVPLSAPLMILWGIDFLCTPVWVWRKNKAHVDEACNE